MASLLLLISFQGNIQASLPDQSNNSINSWQQYALPEEAGWSSDKLEEARQHSEKIGSAAVMVVYKGKVLAAWGNIERRYRCHSVRKSFLSALFGIHIGEGRIDLHKTKAHRKNGWIIWSLSPGSPLIFRTRVTNSGSGTFNSDGQDRVANNIWAFVDFDFIETLKIELVAHSPGP